MLNERKKRTALIVDDIPEYADTIEAYLEDDFHVIKAHNLEEANRLASENAISIALIDIRLKDEDPHNQDGLVFLKRLKDTSPKTGIIVMSAYRDFEHAVEALNAGADHFMTKPVSTEELLSAIAKLMEESEHPR